MVEKLNKVVKLAKELWPELDKGPAEKLFAAGKDIERADIVDAMGLAEMVKGKRQNTNPYRDAETAALMESKEWYKTAKEEDVDRAQKLLALLFTVTDPVTEFQVIHPVRVEVEGEAQVEKKASPVQVAGAANRAEAEEMEEVWRQAQAASEKAQEPTKTQGLMATLLGTVVKGTGSQRGK